MAQLSQLAARLKAKRETRVRVSPQAGRANQTMEPIEPPWQAIKEWIPALRSGHRLFQRPSPQKQFLSNQLILTGGGNDGPMDDPDRDGICNLLEFALNGAPKVASRTILPVSSPHAGSLVFEYDRSVVSRPPDATQIVEYSTNLKDWTQVTIPFTSSGPETITLGATIDHVQVIVPVSGTKVFARLRVIAN